MKAPGVRWRIIGTCFLATAINYLDRQCLSVTAPAITREFHLSNADYSSIITSFLIAYTIMQSLSGRIVDRLGTRAGMALSVVWWSLAAMAHAFASGLWSLRVFRFLLGMGEAGNWPAATKAVSEWFPARERGLAVAIFDSGSSLGGMLAPPLVAWIAMHYGWRPAFAITGSIGFLWLVWWLRYYRTPEHHPAIGKPELEMILAGRATAAAARPVRWISLLAYREVWGVILGRMLTDCVWWFYVYWLPKYLSDQRGFTVAQIGLLAWIPFLAVDVGNLSGGWFSGYLLRRGWSLNGARKSVLAMGAVGMVAGLPAGMVDSAGLCLALIALATLCYATWGTLMLTLPADLFPGAAVASVSGLSGTGAGLGGIAFTWVTGQVVDRLSYQPMFVAAGMLPLVALVVVHLLIPRVAEVQLRAGHAGPARRA